MSEIHILKYSHDFSRRKFLKDAGRGVLAAGVLSPLWQAIAETGEISKAYPEELLSIENYTRGGISNGDYIDASNVEQVKELLEPIRYEQILKHGRRLKIFPGAPYNKKGQGFYNPWPFFCASNNSQPLSWTAQLTAQAMTDYLHA